MQKKQAIIVLILLVPVIIFANNFSVIETTFKNKENINDNRITTYAQSGNLRLSEQYIVLNLKERKYIKEILLLWHKKYFPKNYKILGSNDYLNWFIIKDNITVKKNKIKGNNYVNEVSINYRVAQFIKIYIPQIPESDRAKIVKIAEINIKYKSRIKPTIERFKVTKIDKYSAIINWETDYETLGQVRYGLSPEDVNKVHAEYFFTKRHNIKIANLKRGKTYFFQIINMTPDGKVITSPLRKFKTKGIPLPEIVNISIIEKTYNKVKLLIESNIPTKLGFYYGKKSGVYQKKLTKNKYQKKHLIDIKGLRPLNKYYYKVVIKDKENNQYSRVGNFITGEYNIALNKPVEGTFKNTYIADVFRLKGDILKRVNDGSFDYRKGMAVSFNPAKSDQFVIIDLKKIEPVSKIITYWRALAYPYFYYIYYSNNKKEWKKYKKIVKLKDKKPRMVPGSGIPMKIGETEFKNFKARYIKIFIPKGAPYYKRYPKYKFLQLMELKIYGIYKGGY